MKKFKKIMALIITAVMVLSMTGLATFAAEEPPKQNRSISIDGLDEGDKVNFYKILEWADDSNEAKEHNAVQGWYWAEPFATIFNEDDAEGNPDHGAAKLYGAINDKNQLIMTDTLAGDIARAINTETVQAVGKTVAPINDEPVAEVNGKATYTFKNEVVGATDKDGLYMAIVIPKDQDVVYNPIFVHLDSSTNDDSFTIIESSASYMNSPEGTGAAKKSRVTLDKEAHNSRDYTDSLDEEADPVDDGDTTKPGDVLNFTVTSTIPGYGDTFDTPVFILTDKMNTLELATDSIKVYVDGEELDAANYTLTASKTEYKIDFKATYLKTLHVPASLKVEYDAKVLEGANTNVIKEKNTVQVEFSHDPSTENDQTPGGERQYKKDVTNHYTFSIDANNLVGPDEDRIGTSGSEIIKIGVDKDGNPITSEKVYSNVTTTAYQESPLKDAEFTLYGAKLENGEIVIDPENIVRTATSDASGRLNFTGLDAGTYFLQETKAPAGYVKNSDPVKVTIEATLDEQKITEWYDQAGNWYATEAEAQEGANANAALKNKKVTKFEYKTDELVSYTVTYGNLASTYTFGHVHESNNGVIKWSIATSGEAPQSIANVKGVELPSTGGIGTTLFYIVGAILVVGAGVVLITRRRMSAN